MRTISVSLFCQIAAATAILFFAGFSPACASSLQVELVAGNLQIKAVDVPLAEGLRSVDSKTPLLLKTPSIALSEAISTEMAGVSLQAALQQILAGWNYVLFHKKTGLGETGEYLLWVYEKKNGQHNTGSVAPKPAIQVPGYTPPPPINMSRAAYKKLFSDAREVEGQITAEPPLDAPSEFSGIMVFDVKPNSAVADLGIADGDLITDVNGTPIRSSANFAKMLHPQALGERPLVMIQRTRADQTTAPIYIYLQE